MFESIFNQSQLFMCVFAHQSSCHIFILICIKKVPCYVFDEDGKKRDLNPLIKNSGAHLVDSPDDDDFYINICRDISKFSYQINNFPI